MINFRYPNIYQPIFNTDWTFCTLYSGRSTGKTATVIQYIVARCMQDKIYVLCTRQYQSSIKTSTYKELRDFILSQDTLIQYFEIKHDSITHKNGSIIEFKGLERDIYSIKGNKPDLIFVEESVFVTAEGWDILLPTLYKTETARLIQCFNPLSEQDDTYQRFVVNADKLPGKSLVIYATYDDNPFLTDIQRSDIESMKLNDYEKYRHIYEGQPQVIGDDVVFKDRYSINSGFIEGVDYFKEQAKIGIDFGFRDLTSIIEAYILKDGRIYVHREIVFNNQTTKYIVEKIKDIRQERTYLKVYADSASALTINDISNSYGVPNILGAVKGKDSIRDGVEFLKDRKLVINPSCKNLIFEMMNYKYKRDKDNIVLPEYLDLNNHGVDSLRYALNLEIEAIRKRVVVSDNVLSMF